MDAFSAITGFLGGGLIYLVPFVLVLTVVVFVHESGHFWMGRLFGTRIETFSIGFGRSLASWTDRKGTVWKIGWLPVGGYVKFWGDEDATSLPDSERLARIAEDPNAAQSFHFKPLWQKSLIVVAGPLANFVFAIAVYVLLFMVMGITIVSPLVGDVRKGSPAETAGIHSGDLIVSVDHTPVDDFGAIERIVMPSGGSPLDVGLRRGEADLTVTVTPERMETTDLLGRKQYEYRLGIGSSPDAPRRHEQLGFGDALSKATGQIAFVVTSTIKFIGRLITGNEDPRKLSGPVGIGETAGKLAQIDMMLLIELAALLSISIGLVNLFPIPMLDGGHLLFYGIEAVRRRPMGERSQEYALRIGLALVLSLMLFATWNDLMRIFWS
ncbi:Metalloprotease MmpA [Alphaproteobacteria bacterium SO-S41]|nr:Metalloprotease MmpA [Alphaproteobacteria bacterium SO-S41]